MNYKRIFKSRTFRVKLLAMFSWIPDSLMLRVQYYIKMGRWPDLENPKRFTEKLQLYKLKYRNPDMLRCTDKYEVRNFVEEKGLGKYLIPLIGIYDRVEEIDFKDLPQQFVAKTTDGGGGNEVLVCKDKNELSETFFYDKLNGWMSMPKKVKTAGREWAYENHFPRRILIEQLIGDEKVADLLDYKFFCFEGRVAYVYGISDRKVGVSVQLGIYDADFNKLDVDRCDERHQDVVLPKPPKYERMLEVAKRLSEGFPHVRVDLYNVNGKIYFGELTFYDGSGYMTFAPDSFDFDLGERFTEY